MGTAEAALQNGLILIRSHIVTYGHAADADITERIRAEIESMWNAPLSIVVRHGHSLQVRFVITAMHTPALQPEEVYYNTDPRNNYFRIEKTAAGNISSVDGLGSNTGFFYWITCMKVQPQPPTNMVIPWAFLILRKLISEAGALLPSCVRVARWLTLHFSTIRLLLPATTKTAAPCTRGFAR